MRVYRSCSNASQLVLAALLLAGCGASLSTDSAVSSRNHSRPASDSPAWLRDVSRDARIDFAHDPGRFADYEMPSIMGSGGGFVDYDRDGQLDCYVVIGNRSGSRGDALFRQTDGRRFADVSGMTGISAGEFGMGAWWGDLDDDGFPDLFLSNVGANRLFHNQGDGTFREVTVAETPDPLAWSTAACWTDLNRDGLLDLLSVNYVDYVPDQPCEGPDGRAEFCGPDAYRGSVTNLYINRGSWNDERGAPFVEETIPRGLGDVRGKGLGAIARDFNSDLRPDLYVANDMEPNRLWIQQEDGTFQDAAELVGVARNFLGQSEASMGVVTGDWNADGLPDLFMSHLTGETNTLYLSAPGGFWRDATASSGVGPPSLADTGFGIAAVDLEHDGDIDFLVVNGAVQRPSSARSTDDPRTSYAQRNRVYLQTGKGPAFADRSEVGGEFSREVEISRGLAVGDYDRDGDCDFLLTNCAGPARLYETQVPGAGHWLSLRLIDTQGNREATGSIVQVRIPGATLLRDVNPYQGYLTQNDPRLHLGLGSHSTYNTIEVCWPDGCRETFSGGPADRRLTLVRGGRCLVDMAGGTGSSR